MPSERRLGSPDAKNRNALLDAAEQLLLEHGHTAVTVRRVAAKAGLKYQLVHYYFRTMDDLFLDVFRRRAEEGLEHLAKLLACDQPLRALWEFNLEPPGTRMAMEFVGLATQRPAIRDEIARYAERLRAAQTEALTDVLHRYGVNEDDCPPAVLAVLITSISRMVVIEQVIGMSAGHAATFAFVEKWLDELEGSRQPPAPVD